MNWQYILSIILNSQNSFYFFSNRDSISSMSLETLGRESLRLFRYSDMLVKIKVNSIENYK